MNLDNQDDLIEKIKALASREPESIMNLSAEFGIEWRSLAGVMTDLKVRGLDGYRVTNKRVYLRELGCAVKLWSVTADASAVRHGHSCDGIPESVKKRLVGERAQIICDRLKDRDWFVSKDVYQEFNISLREFCGVLKHINMHGVGEYSLEQKIVKYKSLWRFVYVGERESEPEETKAVKDSKHLFYALLTSPVPMGLRTP